tara:strand:- start:392 stop:874 length:483 start_codon:yes stop_codon:yes gene_type:complete
MKKILFPLLAALTFPTPLTANSTWVKVYSARSMCEVYGYGYRSNCDQILTPFENFLQKGTRYESFVDAKSIVKRGSIRDFIGKVNFIDKDTGFHEAINSHTYDCSNQTYWDYTSNEWIDWKEELGMIIIGSDTDKYYKAQKYKGMQPRELAEYNFVCRDY